MIGATVCSGIGAPEVAMPWVEWRYAAEIAPFPRAVHAHHHPNVEMFGDFTVMRDDPRMGEVELLVGGTPCQSFSIAGLRGSLDDDRGNLTLEFVRLANAIDDLRRAAGQPEAYILFENVPGILSVSDNAFGALLGGLVGSESAIVPNGRWSNAGVVAGPRRIAAWRILDAQYFGVPQRRRRVFVLAHGHTRGWRCAEALLPVTNRLQGHPAPSREKGQSAPTIPSRSTGGGGLGTDFDCDGGLIGQQWPVDVAPTLNAHFGAKQGLEDQHIRGGADSSFPQVAMCLNAGGQGRQDAESETLIPINRCDFDVAHALRGEGFDASEDGTGRGTPLVPCFAIQERVVSENTDAGPQGKGYQPDTAYTLEARNKVQAVAFVQNSRDEVRIFGGDGQSVGALAAEPGMKQQSYIAFRTSANCGAWETGDRVDALTTGTDQTSHVLAFSAKDHGADAMEDCSPTLRAGGHSGSHANAGVMPAVAYDMRGREGGAQFEGPHDTANIRAANGGSSRSYVASSAVRRLTPTECARLQGFPDDYLDIAYRGKPAADGPKYKALGNSMAVPVMRHIGERIRQVEAIAAGEP